MHDWDFLLVPYSGDARGLDLTLHLERRGDVIHFRYRLNGSGVSRVVRFSTVRSADPADQTIGRKDELWKTTCFEFFIGRPTDTSYIEINLSLSREWNVYQLSDYRKGLHPVEGARSPLAEVSASDDSLELAGEIALNDFQLHGPVVLGASAVMEYQDGQKDYWALAHKGEKPDFHDRSSFIAHL